MKKKKSTKAKIRNLVRILVILFLAMIITIICCKKQADAKNKILETAVNDAFVYQSLMLANSLDPNKPNSYTDIESLEDDSDSFVSDAAIKTGKSQYYIRVNYGANCVNIYTKDDEGNYTKPYKAMICSTGKSTPKSGTYKITYKYRWLRLFGDVYGQYSTRIVKNILFHSVPYLEQRADTLEYEEYDKLGTTASAGCIRLTVQDAKWIYDNITSGTYVEFYSDRGNPGPLGKPDAEKISDNKKCRNWDPTDPDKNNPWNGGSGIPSITYTTNNKNTNKNKNTSTSTNKNTSVKNTVNNTNKLKEDSKNTTKKPTQSNTSNTTNSNTSNTKNEINNNKENTNTSTNSTTTDKNTNTSSQNTSKDNNTTKPNTNSVVDNKPQTNTVKPSDTNTTKPPEEPSTKPNTNTVKPESNTTTPNTESNNV